MKLLDLINGLKKIYKQQGDSDVEARIKYNGGLLTTEGESLVLELTEPKIPVPEKDPRSRAGVKFTPEQEKQIRSLSTDDSDTKLGRDKAGDGK